MPLYNKKKKNLRLLVLTISLNAPKTSACKYINSKHFPKIGAFAIEVILNADSKLPNRKIYCVHSPAFGTGENSSELIVSKIIIIIVHIISIIVIMKL